MDNSSPTFARFLITTTCAGLLLAGAISAGNLTLSALGKEITAEKLEFRREQPPYVSTNGLPSLSTDNPLLWTELGKDGIFQLPVLSNVGFSLSTNGFRLASSANWTQEVTWSVRANNKAAMEFTFPPSAEIAYKQENQAKFVAVYLTDGDSHWRASRIVANTEHGEKNTIADRLQYGRWYQFPITEEEQEKGRKLLRFFQLMGQDIAVSAVAVY